MRIRYCDRCKKKVTGEINSTERFDEALETPFYEIMEEFATFGEPKSIDLCCDCSKELYNWIWRYREGD